MDGTTVVKIDKSRESNINTKITQLLNYI